MNIYCGVSSTNFRVDQDNLMNKEVFIEGINSIHNICPTDTEYVSKQSIERNNDSIKDKNDETDLNKVSSNENLKQHSNKMKKRNRL